MSYLKRKRSFTDKIRTNQIALKKNIYYVMFDNIIVIGDFNEMKYYYLDEISSAFFTNILELKTIDIAASNLEKQIKVPRDELIPELLKWCIDMCDRNILYVKKRGS